jgi:hypothetical protein
VARDEVEAFIEKARAAGAKIGATGDYGFMYQRDFQDPGRYSGRVPRRRNARALKSSPSI